MYLNFIKRKLIFIAKRKLSTVKSLNNLKQSTNTLIVHFKHELSDTQIYPFYFYRSQLKQQHGIKFQEINLSHLDLPNQDLQSQAAQNSHVKRIYFQHGFMMPDHELEACLKHLKQVFPAAKIALMDWFAPLTIKYATVADPYIDQYLKKQTYKNFSDYSKTTIGDTNLSDYYAKRHQIDLPEITFTPPVGFEQKIRLWPNFYLSPQMVDLFLGSPPKSNQRAIDLHARIATKGCDWYSAMRQESADAIKPLTGYTIASKGRVRRHKFFDELRDSKIVFSPFGYGEVCWRDYEAYATGSLLLKPSMDHLKTFSEDFVKDETYVELNWDLADLKQNLDTLLADETLRKKITLNAFNYYHQLLSSDEIPTKIGATFA